MTPRLLASLAAGVAGALALVGLYLAIVTLAQGPDHAAELLWRDRALVAAIAAGFGAQVGLFTSLWLLRRALAARTLGLTGAGTTTSSVSMLACCAHHLADVLPVVGLSGLAVFLVEVRTPLVMLGLATNGLGIVVMVRELRRVRTLERVAAQAFA